MLLSHIFYPIYGLLAALAFRILLEFLPKKVSDKIVEIPMIPILLIVGGGGLMSYILTLSVWQSPVCIACGCIWLLTGVILLFKRWQKKRKLIDLTAFTFV